MKIKIIDYGMGNVHSVYNALKYIGYASEIVSTPEAIKKADTIIFPGVGAFGEGMEELKKRGLVGSILTHIEAGKPFLGLCLGMHLLFESSTEHGFFQGLGVFKGTVERFSDDLNLKIPHMGWNSLSLCNENKIFNNIPENPYVYFVHSYYVKPDNENIIASKTDYGINFCSMVIQDNIYAMQFHPEKSQKTGLKLLDNFCKGCM